MTEVDDATKGRLRAVLNAAINEVEAGQVVGLAVVMIEPGTGKATVSWHAPLHLLAGALGYAQWAAHRLMAEGAQPQQPV